MRTMLNGTQLKIPLRKIVLVYFVHEECMCVCMSTCAHEHVCVCVCENIGFPTLVLQSLQASQSSGFLDYSYIFLFEMGFLTETGAHLLGRLSS